MKRHIKRAWRSHGDRITSSATINFPFTTRSSIACKKKKEVEGKIRVSLVQILKML